jgi:glycosyltransferase involved in cell wall biosynthesis
MSSTPSLERPRERSAERSPIDCFVSVVVPLWKDAAIVEPFVRETIAVLEANFTYYELLLVDDGSTDGTAVRVESLLSELPSIRLLRLSRHFGDEVAVAAGLDAVIGDYVVTMLPATDPPALIPRFVECARQHDGVVIGVRSTREESLGAKLGAAVFYWICNRFLELDLPRSSTHFRAFSRKTLNALLQIKDKYRYLKVFSTYIGYHHETIVYEPKPRTGATLPPQRGLFRSVELAINVMVANSTRLLRLVTGLGLIASALNLLYIVYIFLIAVFKKHVAEGWVTLSAQHAGMFFFLFVILTVLGEYVGRILAETQDRPLYYVMEERDSSVLVTNSDRKNVVTSTLPHA